MASWSTKRKYGYFFIFAAAIIVILGVPSFLFFYKAPTCFDGKQNGTERGIDCGGSCVRLCPADFAEPRVLWSYSVRVLPGIYNALAYIQNPNPAVEVKSMPYTFRLYDAEGLLISERTGYAYVPAGQKFAVFEGGITSGNRVPVRTTFEFTAVPEWRQGTILSKVHTLSTDLTQGASPKATVVDRNDAVDRSFSSITAFIVLYDKNDNRVSFSKTLIDSIQPGESKTLYFTWPEAFAADVVRTEVLYVGTAR